VTLNPPSSKSCKPASSVFRPVGFGILTICICYTLLVAIGPVQQGGNRPLPPLGGLRNPLSATTCLPLCQECQQAIAIASCLVLSNYRLQLKCQMSHVTCHMLLVTSS
jgi:hypothetical protein